MISREDLVSLSEPKQGLAVSFYLPTQRAGKPTRENPIRMKNRIVEARQRLEGLGLDTREIDVLLAPALGLLDDYEFWQHQLDGLALFMADGEDHRHQVERELPDLSVIGSRYHLKPLMPLLNKSESFFVLAASLGKTRLFDVDRDAATEVELPEDTPRSLAQALRFTDDDPDSTVRWHTVGRSETHELDAMYHGSGPEHPDRKKEILTFFKMLDNGVRKVAAGSEKPLLFMGVDYLFSIYHEANHYPHFIEDERIVGNPDQWDAEEIRQRSWELMRDRLDRPRLRAEARFMELSGTGDTGDDLEEVILAGLDGRIDTLFVALDRERWGAFDPVNRAFGSADEQRQAEDLLDRAAVEALRTGAAVFPVPQAQVPSGKEVAAIYRY